MKIIEDKKNNLLSRQEVKILVEAEKTPSMAEAKKIIGEHFKKEEELLVIDKIKGKFGVKTFLINAKVYDSKEAKEKIEPKKKEKKIEGGATPAEGAK